MADLNIALILRLVDRATAPARAAMRATRAIVGRTSRSCAHQARVPRSRKKSLIRRSPS